MSTSLFNRFAGAALSALIVLSSAACATPNRGGGGGGRAGTNTTPGQKGGAGTTGIHSGIMGGGAGAGGGGTAGGGMNRTGNRADLGQELSAFIAGLDGMGYGGAGGGGTTGAGMTGGVGGTAPGTAGGAGTAGGGTTDAGARRSVGVSTLVLGNVAFVGIDTATLHGGTMGGMTGTTMGTTGTTMGTTGTTMGTTGAGGDMETRIRSAVRSAYPQIADVIVTTSPTMVFRIARVTSDLQAGLPGTYRLTEMFSIARAMSPGTDPGARGR